CSSLDSTPSPAPVSRGVGRVGDAVPAVPQSLPPTLPPSPAPQPSPTPRGGGVEVDFYDLNLPESDVENFDKRLQELTDPVVALDNTVPRTVLIDAYKELARYKPVGGKWRGIGPAPIESVNLPQGQISSGGKVNGFAIDPRNTSVVYAAASFGGIWKTTDGGKSWKCLTDFQVPMVYGGIEMDPRNPDVLYGLLGEFAPSLIRQYGYLANGIMRTRDGGKTWQLIGADVFNGAAVSALAFDSKGTLYAGTGLEAPIAGPSDRPDFGVFKSTNGGDTWQRVLACDSRCAPPKDSGWQDIAGGVMDLDGGSDDSIHVSLCYFLCQGNVLLRSRDGGKSWKELNFRNVLKDWEKENGTAIMPGAVPSVPSVEGIELAIAKTNPKVLLAGGGIEFQKIQAGGKKTNVSIRSWSFAMRSRDGGDTWEWLPEAGDYCTGTGGNMQCPYDNIVEIDPTNEQIMYLGGSFSRDPDTYEWVKIIQRSADGGDTWVDTNPSDNEESWMHPDSHGLAIDPKNPKVVWVGGDGGIYRTSDASQDPPVWQHMSKGIDTLLFIDIGLHPTNRNYIIGGLQDNGVTFTTDGGKSWPGASQGDAGYSAVDPFEPDIVYSTWPLGGFKRNIQRGEGGYMTGWYEYIDGLDLIVDEWQFYPPFVVDPKNEGVIYFASNRVYKTENRGEKWVPISDYFHTGSRQSVRTLALGYNDSRVLYAGTTEGRIWVSTDGGKKWADVTSSKFPQSPPRMVNRIAVDPNDATIAYAIFGGFNRVTPEKPGHVFRTTDAGQTWEDISYNLPDAPLGAAVVDVRPQYNGVYVGGSLGVWVLQKGSKQWLPYGTGMPYSLITDIELNTQTGIMAVATYGRSIWVIDMP
ncbi:MAG: hypothetical protein M1546_07635, partial [Chloroflexi bacterium]|nr:hypothetical protein [Chloroflexota bacterium]